MTTWQGQISVNQNKLRLKWTLSLQAPLCIAPPCFMACQYWIYCVVYHILCWRPCHFSSWVDSWSQTRQRSLVAIINDECSVESLPCCSRECSWCESSLLSAASGNNSFLKSLCVTPCLTFAGCANKTATGLCRHITRLRRRNQRFVYLLI